MKKEKEIVKIDEENLTKKAKTFSVWAAVICILAGVILIVTSIIQLLFDLKVILVSNKFSSLFDIISIVVVVALLIVAFVLYKLFKKEIGKQKNG